MNYSVILNLYIPFSQSYNNSLKYLRKFERQLRDKPTKLKKQSYKWDVANESSFLNTLFSCKMLIFILKRKYNLKFQWVKIWG